MTSHLDTSRNGGAVHVVLNRPQALNALNLDMVRELARILDEAKADDSVTCLILRGAGERAFCAGGDIKAAREMGLKAQVGDMPFDDVVQFFREEYALNKKLFHFQKPIIVVMHGITMGGGVGLAAPCRYRVATEATQWAMPEVNIGFFPDIGAGYYLTRLGHKVGVYLGLTGESVKNKADLVKCGLATHALPSDQIDAMVEALAFASHDQDIKRILDHFCFVPLLPELPYKLIEEIFSAASLDAILKGLRAEQSLWARHAHDVILSKSPLSVKVTFEHLKAAMIEDFNTIIDRDYHLACEFMKDSDMFEGIRAMLVDKDKKPQWASRWEDTLPAQFEKLFYQGQKVA